MLLLQAPFLCLSPISIYFPFPRRICGRFAVGARGKNVFTRSQQGGLFKASYQELPVHCRWLTNKGNFKALFTQRKGAVNKIPRITKFRAFRIERVGGEATVKVKEFMHSEQWCGFTASGSPAADAPPHEMFPGRAPRIRDAPPFLLKKLDDGLVKKIEQRYLASQSRLATRYFDGKLHCKK